MIKVYDIYRERLKGTSSATVTSLSTDRVRAHEFRFVMHLSVYNGDATDRDVEVYIDTHGYNHRVAYFNTVSAGEWRHRKLELYLEQNERLTMNVVSMAANKTMEAHLSGILLKKDKIEKEE